MDPIQKIKMATLGGHFEIMSKKLIKIIKNFEKYITLPILINCRISYDKEYQLIHFNLIYS